MTRSNLIFIPGAVPSSKNGRIMLKSGFSIGSKATQKYKKLSAPYWLKYKKEFLKFIAHTPKPYFIGFHFVRGSKHKWDFINPAQTIQDEMTKAGWIDDDNVHEILPVPLSINSEYWSYNKKTPGVYIAVLGDPCQGIMSV